MSRAEDYRARAGECDHRAECVNDPVVKAEFSEMAQQWRHMAEQIEQLERERRS
jgi:hypothetical protein